MSAARHSLLFFLLAGLPFGCSAGSPSPTNSLSIPPTSSSVAAADKPPEVTASAAIPAPNAPPARAPLPAAPAGVDPERFEVLASICGVANYLQDGQARVGCRSGPPFAKQEHKPDGIIQSKADLYEVCLLSQFYKGSFSAAGKEQALLGIDPCGSDRANDISPGNVLLAERGPDGWQLVDYIQGLNINNCDIANRKDGSLLVCSDNMGAYGDGRLRWNFTLDFSKPAGKRVVVFSKIFSDAGISCMGTSLIEERGLTGAEEIKREFKDLNKDGFDDLRLTVEWAHLSGTPTVLKRVEAACKKNGNMVLEEKVILGKYKRFTLEFHGNETTLSPTPATQKLLEKWSETAPNFWWNVIN